MEEASKSLGSGVQGGGSYARVVAGLDWELVTGGAREAEEEEEASSKKGRNFAAGLFAEDSSLLRDPPTNAPISSHSPDAPSKPSPSSTFPPTSSLKSPIDTPPTPSSFIVCRLPVQVRSSVS